MFYRGRKGIKAPIRRNYKINAFGGYRSGRAENLIDLGESKYCFNVSAKDGELKPGYGSMSAQIVGSGTGTYLIPQPKEPIDGAWYYKRFDVLSGERDDKLLVHTVTGQFLLLNVSKKANAYSSLVSGYGEVYSAQNYKLGNTDIMLIATKMAFLILDGDSITTLNSAPKIKNLCMHNERAFATVQDEDKLWFSKSLDPTDWTVGAGTDGGYITFADSGGKLTKLVSLMGYLYVFREYGIERVSAFADQSEFTVRKIYNSTDRIFEKTIAICGDYILFLSETGLYKFDGANVSKLSVLTQKDIGNFACDAVGAYFRGIYFLGCYLEHLDSEDTGQKRAEFDLNNCMLLYDLNDGKVQIMMDYDVAGFVCVTTEGTSELLFWLNPELQGTTKFGCMQEYKNIRLGKSTQAYWRTGMTDLGYPEKKKLLRSVTASAEGKVGVGVILDDERVDLGEISGHGIKIHVNKPFTKVGLYFKTMDRNFSISNPVITVDMR